jgi:hypothetical protein
MVFRMSAGRSSRVVIDGREFVGSSISINRDGVVIVDGIAQDGELVGPVNVVVHGDVTNVETTSGSIEVTGQAGSVQTTSGDVRCGNVNGSVQTVSGDVTATTISGGARSFSGDMSSTCFMCDHVWYPRLPSRSLARSRGRKSTTTK